MNIGVIAPEFPPAIGGVETYSYEFVRALAQRGHHVTVFTRPNKNYERIHIPNGVKIIREITLRKRKDSKIFARHNFDVWHVMNAAYSWLGLEKDNVIVSIHGNDFLRPYILLCSPDLHEHRRLWRHDRLRNWLKRFDKHVGRWLTARLLEQSLPHAAHILANSRYTEEVFLKKFPSCRGLTSVGLVGVADRFFEIQHVPRAEGQPPRLMTLCRLSEQRKNVDKVLRALGNLNDQYDFHFDIVGDGYLRPSLERLTHELQLSDKVNFCGFLSNKELEQKFAASDLFILTSSVLPDSHEGFGIVYLEANACGTPVLAARLAGAVEAVEEGVSGMFVDTPSIEEITARLQDFLSGRVKFDSDACRRFAHRFSWARVVECVEPAYRNAIKRADK